jgi:protein-disulfide isomerase
MARTAVVAGTATAVSNRVSRRQANRWAEQGEQYAPVQRVGYTQEEDPQAAPPPAQPAADPIAQLKELAELKDQGILTEQEFADQKAKILGN